MSLFFKFLSTLCLVAMLFIGFLDIVSFLKEKRLEYISAHSPDIVLEDGRSCWIINERTVCDQKTLPEECAHLYDMDKHEEWADCMGVGYK